MRSIILALLLLLPASAFAQFENNPTQQRLWTAMTNVAGTYQMLLACDRDYTAGLVYDEIVKFTRPLIQNQSDLDIAGEMWAAALNQASVTYRSAISKLERNPQGEACNYLESEAIRILDRGI